MRRRLACVFAALALCAAPALAAQDGEHQAEPSRHTETAQDDAHGTSHGAHEPSFDSVNWFHGFLGEKEGVEPDVLWRAPGTPAPFGALLLNAAILYFILFKLLGTPISKGLKSRKEGILRGMEESARMKREAEKQLEHYEARLENIDQEIERVRREMHDSGVMERSRVLSEAKERRARMEREAHLLIEQELKAAREVLLREAVRSAVASATVTLSTRITPSDQQRLADEYLAGLRQSAASLRGKV